MPDKLKDSEIVKALKYCTNNDECGTDCPCFSEQKSMCGNYNGLLKQTLDLINRLQAENEKNKDSIRLLQLALDQKRRKIVRLEEENQELRAENEEQEKAIINALHQMKEVRLTAKAEAYKEFAERLKRITEHIYYEPCIVDDLLKELVGE